MIDRFEKILSSKSCSILILVAISFLVFANTLYNGFVFDDGFQVIENLWIRDISYIPDIFTTSAWGFKAGSTSNYYRPLMHVFFMIDFHLFGLAPWGFHLTNIIVHCLNTVLLYLIACLLLRAAAKEGKNETALVPGPYLAFASALLFAIHPVHSEVVAWISAIPEASFTLFFFISLYTYMLYGRKRDTGVEGNTPLFIISIASFLISLLCKETGITLIGVIIVYDLSRGRAYLRIKRYLPYLVIIIVYLTLRIIIFGALIGSAQHSELTRLDYFLNVFPLIKDYLWLMLWPVNLNAFILFRPITGITNAGFLLSLITAVALLMIIIVKRKNRVIFFSLLLAIFTLSPALYIPAIGATKAAVFHDRYLYLPSAGLIIAAIYMIAWGAGKITPRRASLTFSLIIIIIATAASILTISRNRVWFDNYAFWSDVARNTTESSIVYTNLGSAADERGLSDEALSAYNKSLQIDPSVAATHNNIGYLYFKTGKIKIAIESYQRALELGADSRERERILENLGDAFIKDARVTQAIEAYQNSIDINRGNANIYNKLGVAYAKTGRFNEAGTSFTRALEINPAHIGAKRNLEKLLKLER